MWRDLPFLWAITLLVFGGTLLYVGALVRRERRLRERLAKLEQFLED